MKEKINTYLQIKQLHALPSHIALLSYKHSTPGFQNTKLRRMRALKQFGAEAKPGKIFLMYTWDKNISFSRERVSPGFYGHVLKVVSLGKITLFVNSPHNAIIETILLHINTSKNLLNFCFEKFTQSFGALLISS